MDRRDEFVGVSRAAEIGARTVTSWAALMAIWGGFAVLPAKASLTHQYTFNDSTANDSVVVGQANGTLLGGASVDVNGVLQLSGAGTDYVSLPGPVINISSYTDLTLEAWFSFDAAQTWQRMFDFGDRAVAAAQQGYIYYTPNNPSNVGLGVYATGGQRTEATGSALQAGHLYHLALVIDDDANGGTDTMSVYLDGRCNRRFPIPSR